MIDLAEPPAQSVGGSLLHFAYDWSGHHRVYSIPVTMIGVVFTYKAVIGRNVLWLDIAVFGLTIAVAQTIFVGLFRGLDASLVVVVISGVYLAGIVAAYLLFTLRPRESPTSSWTRSPTGTDWRGTRRSARATARAGTIKWSRGPVRVRGRDPGRKPRDPARRA